jgi:thiol:disulfide interchange protein
MQAVQKGFSTQKILAITAGGLILACAGIVFRDRICQPTQAFCDTQANSNPSDSQTELAPNYFVYSAENLKEAHIQRQKVVLYFWAPWCVSCTTLDQDILDHKVQVPPDVTLLRVPYDTAHDLKQKYQIITQHSFVRLDDHDNSLGSWVGGGMEELNKHL